MSQIESLIEDMQALARIGRGARPAEHVHLAEIVDEVLAELGSPIRARSIKVVVNGTGTFWGVRSELLQVFANLIGNAVKYMGDTPEPTIELGLRRGDDMLECYVRDNGIGIDPAYHGKIFEVFQRLNEVPVAGSGVGLAVVRKIVEGAGGRVWVESAPAQGATFHFTWPAAPAA